jgi:hypothetical protein
MNIIFSSLLAALLAAGGLSGASPRQMRADLENIRQSFDIKYAPADWKKQLFGWQLDDQIDQIAAELSKDRPLDVKGFQLLLHKFFCSTCDYHVQDHYHAREAGLLPFDVEGCEGRFFVTYADPYEEVFLHSTVDGAFAGTLQRGDELLEINGHTPGAAVEAILREIVGNVDSRASQRMAELLLTTRIAAFGHEVMQGKVVLKVRRSDGTLAAGRTEWRYLPELIRNKAVLSSKKPKMMAAPLAHALQQRRKDKLANLRHEHSEMAMGDIDEPLHREQILFGRFLWVEPVDSPFRGYIYQSPYSQARIGYIRIDSYVPGISLEEVNAAATQLGDLLTFYGKQTDALLIDQVDNSGGYALYLYGILSMLSDRPLQVPFHRRMITQEDVANAYNALDLMALGWNSPVDEESYLYGYPNDLDFDIAQINEHSFIISQWEEGKSYTDPFPLYGLETIKPHSSVCYRKPIVVLANHQDFSAADFLPAILQDNGRATIFGEQTAGAGGVVDTHHFPNLSGLAYYSYTSTFAERPTGLPIENLGVTPDVPYKLTVNDLLGGYRGYIAAVNRTLEMAISVAEGL